MSAFATSSEERPDVAGTIGTAPRSPAHPSKARSRVVKSNSMVDAQTATGRITSVRSKASAGREHHRSQLVREHEQAENDE